MGHETTVFPAGWPQLDALVDAVVDARRTSARAQAEESRLLADAVDLVVARIGARRSLDLRRRSDADLPMREVAAELATAMRISDRTVQRRMGDASHLVNRFPDTLRAWEEGRIDGPHVNAILDAGIGIDDEEGRRRFEVLALDVALTETAARLRAAAPAFAAQVDPGGAADRMRRRAAERQVRVYDLGEGQARLLADLPATLAHAVYDRLTRLAHAVQDGDEQCVERGDHEVDPSVDDDDVVDASDPDPLFVTGPAVVAGVASPHSDPPTERATGTATDPRTLDQLRADVLCDLLLAGGPIAHGEGLEAIAGHVQVTIPARTLADGSARVGLLAGSGTVDAETIRCLAARAPGWDRVFTDPLSGAVLAVDRYRPSAELKRFLRARDETCRFPGCRRAARGCDIDHTHDAARGGPTRVDNLAHLCRRHHTLKHESAWTVRQRVGGVIEWRSPLGRRYFDRPPAIVRFVPSNADPPPF